MRWLAKGLQWEILMLIRLQRESWLRVHRRKSLTLSVTARRNHGLGHSLALHRENFLLSSLCQFAEKSTEHVVFDECQVSVGAACIYSVL